MPGLSFQTLPANQYKQLPYPQVKKIRDDLNKQWQIENEALNKSWFSNRGQYETAKAKLNAKYKQKEYEAFKNLQAKLQEQEQVRQLIKQRSGQGLGLKPEEEAIVRMNLRPEVERLVFPQTTNWATEHARNLQERNRLISIVETFTVTPSGQIKFTPKDNKGDVIEDRTATKDEITLFQNAAQALATLEKQEREEILPNLTGVERSATRGQQIIQQRREKTFWEKHKKLRLIPAIGLPAYLSHRIEKSKTAPTEQKVIRQRNTRTGQERISYDGGKTWQIVNG